MSNQSVFQGIAKSSVGKTIEQVREEGFNYGIEKRELFYMGNDGEQVPVSGKSAIVRNDINHCLSVMSDNYSIIDNDFLLQLGESLIGEGQAKWVGYGSLGMGRRVFLQAEVGNDFYVGGRSDDKVKQYLLLGNSHDGSTTLFGMSLNFRIVCQNTLNAAMNMMKNGKSNFIKVYHRAGYANRVQEAARILKLSTEYFENFKAVSNKLIEAEVSRTYVDGFINALMPAQTKEDGEIATRTANRREEIANLFANGTGNIGKSKWDLWNAVTEYVDHKQHGRVTQKRLSISDASADIEAEQRFERSIFGAGATLKQKAFDLLTA